MSSIPNREMQGGEERGNQSGLRANFFLLFILLPFFLTNTKSQEEKSSHMNNLTQHETFCSSIVRKT